MHIHYHNRTRLSPEIEKALKAEYVSFDDLIAQSDVLSLNLSLNANTKHILSAAEFAKMKTGVVIVNTARGGLIDEEAMIAGLESGKVRLNIYLQRRQNTYSLVKIYSVGLDVYDDEPRVNEAIKNNPNVFLLPHIGTATYETQKIMEEQVLDNVRSAILEGQLITPIVEQQQLDTKI
jgi:D-3-phosphoglycerate dehydrogenase